MPVITLGAIKKSNFLGDYNFFEEKDTKVDKHRD
jgi:hypothetical protein